MVTANSSKNPVWPRMTKNCASHGSMNPTSARQVTYSSLVSSRCSWISTSAKVAVAVRPPMPSSRVVGGRGEVDADLFGEPRGGEAVLASAVHEGEDRAELARFEPDRHDRTEDVLAAAVGFELEVLEVPALRWKLNQGRRATVRRLAGPSRSQRG